MQRPGLRERKKLEAREAFLQAARTLFQRQGFEATTVRQIATEAQMSTRTFFRYFGGKDDIIYAEAERRISELRGRLRPMAGQGSDFEALSRVIVDFAAFIEERELRFLAYSELMDERSPLGVRRAELWQRAALELGDELAAPGASSEEKARARLLTQTATTVLRTAMAWWRTDEEGPGLTAIVEKLLTTLEAEVGAGSRELR